MNFSKLLANTGGSAQDGVDSINPGGVATNLPETIQIIINVALGVIGMVAVIMIIMGGFQYTSSQGDEKKVTKAKNTIMYGVIGLIIALLAFAIVNFVLGSVFGGNTGSGGNAIGG